jgi:hypothetical protein
MKFLYAILVSLLLAISLQAGIINVPADQPTIQAGINAAVDGDTVLVADGTYTENINYLGKAITVASHYLVDGDTAHIDSTIIDGSQPSNPDSGSVVYFISGEDTTSVLTGFTITGGSGTITEFTWQGVVLPVRFGGGILIYNSGTKILHNTIKNNQIPSYDYSYGGGVAGYPNGSSGHVILDDNRIIYNTVNGSPNAGASGALLLCNATLINNVIAQNSCTATDVASGSVECTSDIPGHKVWIKNNLITGNSATGYRAVGGGVDIEYESTVSVIDNEITFNTLNATEQSFGGGIHVVFRTGSDTISGNTIKGNVVNGNSATWGGGITLHKNENASNTLITNNIISGNQAKYGGGIRCIDSRTQIINNTIVNNTASVFSGGLRVEGSSVATVMNTILWGNSAPFDPQITAAGGATNVRYSDVEGSWPGDGNIDLDPQFVPGDSLFHLSDTSPCVNTGADSLQINGLWYFCPPDDYEGHERPYLGIGADMGADETQVPVGIEPQPSAGIPESYALHQNYPNPFNPSTTIEFALAKPGWVTLKVYNILGEEVAELISENDGERGVLLPHRNGSWICADEEDVVD